MDYLQFEKGVIKKSWKDRLSIALVFPNKYSIGMSNLGYLSIYQRLNNFDEIVCERVFLPEKPSVPISVESKKPLNFFDIIIFSISFELDYLNIPSILKWAKIPLYPEERKEIILAGGIATWLNPYPIINFFDGILLGEWETMEKTLVSLFLNYPEKNSLLNELYSLPFFLNSKKKEKVLVVKEKELKTPAFSMLISEKAIFSNTYLIEVSRGCGKGCRFCAAGFVYRPPRVYLFENLKPLLEKIPPFAKIGIIGFEFVDKDTVLKITKLLLEKKAILSFSSLRIDALTKEFIELLKTTHSVAIAPETGSNDLKKVINKKISENEVIETLKLFEEEGLKKVKLYFMLGLPFEEEKDLAETAYFMEKLQKLKFKLELSYSVSIFCPKPHTPFQWMPLYPLKILKKKIQKLRKFLKNPPWLKLDSPREAYLQSLLSRGNENTGKLIEAHDIEKDNPLSLIKDLEKTAILHPEESIEFNFPWDNISVGVKKEYLFEEWKKAKNKVLTPFCNPKICKRCGACE